MVKQYITEEAYTGNTKVTFYVDGCKTYYNIISDWELSGYLRAKQEEGYTEAYSYVDIEDLEEEIESKKQLLEMMKKYPLFVKED